MTGLCESKAFEKGWGSVKERDEELQLKRSLCAKKYYDILDPSEYGSFSRNFTGSVGGCVNIYH